MLYIVAEEVRKAGGAKAVNYTDGGRVGFLLEHPSAPVDLPETVSWWRTVQWTNMKEIYGFREVDVDQGEIGGLACKPTTLGGNLALSFPIMEISSGQKATRNVLNKSPAEIAADSRRLARWTPVLMSSVAEGAMKASGQQVKARLRSWRTHLAREHVPFRKDCRICQEAMGKARPHCRQRVPPRAAVLSLDVAGPFERAPDLGHPHGGKGGWARYILVGTFTWPTGGMGEDVEPGVVEPPGEAPVFPEVVDEGSQELQSESERRDPGDAVPVLPDDVDGHLAVMDERGEAARLMPEGVADGEHVGADLPETEREGDMPQIEVHRLALPMPSRNQDVVLSAVSELFLQLKADGFHVRQIHSDRGGEFLSRKMDSWCKARDIVHTFTPGTDPQMNGRAERAVMEVKNRVRTILLASEAELSWWPFVVRNVNERWRCARIKKLDEFPPFLSTVLVKRRFWRAGDLMPSQEKVRYLCPSWLNHGHWVVREDGTRVLTRSVMSHTMEPHHEGGWVGDDAGEDALEVRRRIRGKTTVAKMVAAEEEVSMEMAGLERALEDELCSLVFDDPEVAQLVWMNTMRLCEMMNREDDEGEQVLQTKIVSPMEARRKPEAWRQAIQAEIDSLFTHKGALRVVSSAEAREIMKGGDVQAVPSKVVLTLKPDPHRPSGKRKCRIVACGNYAKEEEGQDLFASGADSTSLRMVLCEASQRGWHGANLDIRTAFLNAPMKRTGEGSDDGAELKKVLMKPAGLLVSLGYFKADEYWEVLKAVYGFRQSPRLWSDHRDHVMRDMTVGETYIMQMETEPAVWMILEFTSGVLRGVIVTYVDDILVLACRNLVAGWLQCFRATWETTDPEWIDGLKGTRFLGMELFRSDHGEWSISQRNYTFDLLQRNLGKDDSKWPRRKIPISKTYDEDELDEGENEVEEHRTVENVREAQRVVGELVWLVTRSRPDLMYVLSRMASLSTKRPKKVVSMAGQVWRYLASTITEGLKFPREEQEPFIQVFSDASFGEICYGCVVVRWGKSPVL